jgi:hypothetical protein
METMRSRLTYANVMATVAVFIALGGASYAAFKLPKNSVGTKQLKKNSVATAKIKDGAVTGAKINLSTLGTVPSAASAVNAGNANTVGGQPASAFASSTAIRSVTIDKNVNVVDSQSDGVTQANVHQSESTAAICFDGLSPAPKTVVGSLSGGGAFETEIFTLLSPPPGYLCEGSQIAVFTPGGEGGPKLRPFSLIIH